MADLFELTALAALLQTDLDTSSAMEARRQAQAWLASATRLAEWPTPTPEDLRAWALELAGMVYDNPSSLSSSSEGGASSSYNQGRRAEILAEAQARYSAAASGLGPVGVFDSAPSWPDPAAVLVPRRVYTDPVFRRNT